MIVFELENGKGKKITFSNRKSRNKSDSNIRDLEVSEIKKFYGKIIDRRVDGSDGEVLFDIKTSPEIIKMLRSGDLTIDTTYHQVNLPQADESFMDDVDLTRLGKTKWEDVTFADILEAGMIDRIDFFDLDDNLEDTTS